MFSFNFLTHWKTSLLGIVSGLTTYFLQTNPDGGFTWQGAKMALPSILMGLLLKDQNKS